ncbi:MAG: ribonuclease III [Proteobacteria bacterium]|nr:ribonuclease III [Pseudomonadota bacterium]
MADRDPFRPYLQRRRLSKPATSRLAIAARILDHDFTRGELLDEALTHPSAKVGRRSFERLEFLGDRVLGLIVADMLLECFPEEEEGPLAKRFAALVRRRTLAEFAGRLDIGTLIHLSKGEEGSGGRSNPSLLADALEALLGALYLDGGLAPAESFIRRHWTDLMTAADSPPEDSKTRLQEWAQAAGRPLPAYTTIGEEGPAHDPVFEVEVRVADHAAVTGQGRSKRAAEQAAAGAMLASVAKS